MRRVLMIVVLAIGLWVVADTAWAGAQGKGGGEAKKVSSKQEAEDNNDAAASQAAARHAEQLRRREQAKERVREAGKAAEESGQGVPNESRVRDKMKEQEGKAKAAAKEGKAAEMKAKGQGHAAQLSAFDEQLAREKDKHNSRIAKLNRIKELAEQRGQSEKVAKVNQLIEKEQKLYEGKTQRLAERRDKIAALSETEKGKGGESKAGVMKEKGEDDEDDDNGDNDNDDDDNGDDDNGDDDNGDGDDGDDDNGNDDEDDED